MQVSCMALIMTPFFEVMCTRSSKSSSKFRLLISSNYIYLSSETWVCYQKSHTFVLTVTKNFFLSSTNSAVNFVSESCIRLQRSIGTFCKHWNCCFSSLNDNSCWLVKLTIWAVVNSPHVLVSWDTFLRLLRRCWQWSLDSSSIVLFSAFMLLSSWEKLSRDAVNLLWLEFALLTRSVVFLQQHICKSSEILKGRF